MNVKMLPFKLSNEWDKMKCKGHLRNFCFAQVDSLKKELDFQDSLGYKTNQKPLIKECEEFEMALEHKSKLQVYRKLKWEIGFKEYLEYIKGALSRSFLKFLLGTMGF